MRVVLPLMLSAALAMPFLAGCTVAVIGGTAATVAAIHDRRTTGTIIEDQNIKLRVRNLLSDHPEINSRSNISVTSYNQRVLLYGQTEDAALADSFAEKVSKLPKVNAVYNEFIEGARSDAWDYSRDTALVTKIKTLLVNVDVEGFDPTVGTRFSTYASYWIKQSIKRALINLLDYLREDIHLETVLSIRNGRRVFATAAINTESEVVPGDRVH